METFIWLLAIGLVVWAVLALKASERKAGIEAYKKSISGHGDLNDLELALLPEFKMSARYRSLFEKAGIYVEVETDKGPVRNFPKFDSAENFESGIDFTYILPEGMKRQFFIDNVEMMGNLNCRYEAIDSNPGTGRIRVYTRKPNSQETTLEEFF